MSMIMRAGLIWDLQAICVVIGLSECLNKVKGLQALRSCLYAATNGHLPDSVNSDRKHVIRDISIQEFV